MRTNNVDSSDSNVAALRLEARDKVQNERVCSMYDTHIQGVICVCVYSRCCMCMTHTYKV